MKIIIKKIMPALVIASLSLYSTELFAEQKNISEQQELSEQEHQSNPQNNIHNSEQERSQEDSQDVFSLLKKQSESRSSIWYMLLLAFFAGILVSFTPCVYPMIPITVGILQSQARQSLTFNLFSALSYVCGIAVTYASLGYISATSSIIFGRWLASPWFIGLVILFFIYLAFSMFGFYDMYIPRFMQQGVGGGASGSDNAKQKKGSLLHSFLFGVISGTVASPCLTPALAILLGIVAKEANPLLGFSMLFAFSLGMGILLILVGTFSSTLTLLPRAGEWMEHIKTVFGFMMFGVCVYFLQPLISARLSLQLYASVLIIAALYYFIGPKKAGWKMVFGLLLMLGAAALIAMSLKIV
jgi:thiol:disulfide interchange protein DsbD